MEGLKDIEGGGEKIVEYICNQAAGEIKLPTF